MKLIKQHSELKSIADLALRQRIHSEITQLENCCKWRSKVEPLGAFMK